MATLPLSIKHPSVIATLRVLEQRGALTVAEFSRQSGFSPRQSHQLLIWVHAREQVFISGWIHSVRGQPAKIFSVRDDGQSDVKFKRLPVKTVKRNYERRKIFKRINLPGAPKNV